VEDPGGVVNVILSPDVYAASREALHGVFVLIEGAVQKDRGALNIIGRKIEAV